MSRRPMWEAAIGAVDVPVEGPAPEPERPPLRPRRRLDPHVLPSMAATIQRVASHTRPLPEVAE